MANSNKFSGGAVELTGTAQPGDVLKGSTFYNTDEESKLTGTLPVMSNPHYEAQANIGYGAGGWIGLHIPQTGKYNSSSYLWRYVKDLDIGSAQSPSVLQGQYFTSTYGVALEGSMLNRGNWGATINPGGSVTIPSGYHSGGGVVKAQKAGGGYILTSGEVVWNQTADRTIKLSMTCTQNARYRITTEIYGIDGHMHNYDTSATGSKVKDVKESVSGYLTTRVTRVYEGTVTGSSQVVQISQRIYTSSSQMQAILKIEINP